MRTALAALLLSLIAVPLRAQVPRVATFDSAWSIIKRTHFDTTFNGVDWDAARVELRPKAEAAQSDQEIRRVVSDLLARLRQSHFSIIPKDLADTPAGEGGSADAGFDVRYLDGQVVVTQVEPGSPADEAGIRAGWIVRRVGNDSVSAFVERARRSPSRRQTGAMVAALVRNAVNGAPGSKLRLALFDGSNRARQIEVTRRPEPGQPVKFGNLPTFYTRFSAREVSHQDGRFGVLWFNVWLPQILTRFDSAVDRLRATDGIVIDLRGNPGGIGIMATGVAGHFVDTARVIGRMTTRSNKLEFRINPRRSNLAGERVIPFGGPVAILTDEFTASTSEIFAGGMQAMQRMRVFGDTTAGAVLPAHMTRLPNGDVLYHAIADFLTADGALLEGRGVIPDEQVNLTRADLLAGRDPVLDAALNWLAAQAAQKRSTLEMKR
jgi:carboxyl-terminal processing protease